MAVCLLSSGGVWADRVEDLESRIKALETELQAMKAAVEQTKEAVKATPTGGAFDAWQTGRAVTPVEVMPLGGISKSLKIGGDLRFRPTYAENLWDFDDDGWDIPRLPDDTREYYRFRPRVFFDWQMNNDMRAFFKLHKEWLYGQDNEMPGYDVEAKDVAFDNAFVDWNNVFDTGINTRIGRQDLVYGEGFVILDGSPYDGSQTLSFDAMKFSYPFENGNIDVFAAKVQENDTQFADDEDLYGIYTKYNVNDSWGIEPYLLYRNKNDKPEFAANRIDLSPKEQTLLLGARTTLKTDIFEGTTLSMAAEGGKEWGKIDWTNYDARVAAMAANANVTANPFQHGDSLGKEDRDAWGGLIWGQLKQNDWMWKPSLKAGISYLSGDDPDSSDYEGWDDFYSQWPKYSELFVYTMYDGFKVRTGQNDPNLGVWSNMILPEVRIDLSPTAKMGQMLRYVYFMADEDNGPDDGDEMGHNLQWMTTYKFNEYLDGHFLAEYFAPGDYFLNDDDAWFIRFQLLYRF
ncbi:MAG TPA: alginate export family protein [bacterium]|nr:alginate export family protein [bacterium]